MKKLELTFLGQPDFKVENESINNLVLRKGLALVAYLAVTKQAHSREALAGLLWGEMTEENARRNLRVTLTKLRRYFDDHLIIQRRSIAFNVDSDYWLDVDTFEAYLNQQNPTVEQLQTAVDLYHGPFLADLPLRDAPLFEEWVRPYQERLRQMAMDSLYRLAVINTEQHQYAQGIDNLGKLLILEPWMEEAHRQLMLLLALSGQRSIALAQFETCQTVLEEELGVEPSDATIELYEKILNEEIAVDDSQIVAVAPTPPQLIPFQAPAEKRDFINREALLKDICAVLDEEEQPMIQAVVGMGGVGKSALSTRIAHSMRAHFTDGLLWANATISEPMSVLESWAQLYGYDFSHMTDLESMAAAYRGILADKRVLIILDDVTSTSRIRPLLPTGDSCAVLLTTRDQDLARGLDAQVWLMKELSLTNGRLLLTSILGEERVLNEPEAASEICALLENLPLAIEIIAQRLKSRPRRRLADVALRLQDERQRLSELQISDRAVRASFAISYQSLDRPLQRMFALMGMFNGRSFTAEALAYMTELDRYDAEDRIFALTALSLAQEEEPNRYKQHALLADFALEKLGDARGEEYGRFAQYYRHFAQEHYHDYDALRPEWENMMAAMEASYEHKLWESVINFARILKDAWFARGRFAQAYQGFTWAIEAATHQGDPLIEALYKLESARASIKQSNYGQAQDLLATAQITFESMDEQRHLAEVNYELAEIANERGNFEIARNLLYRCQTYYESLPTVDKGLAQVFYKLGDIEYAQGTQLEDDQRAEALLQEALTIYREAEDIYGIIRSLRKLGTIATTSLHDYELAQKYNDEAISPLPNDG